MLICDDKKMRERIERAAKLWLFLDYDGTLADFAPSPDVVQPDARLLDRLARLAGLPGVRLAVVSGRRLSHVVALVPVPGIWLAGSYGIEIRSPSGERIQRIDEEAGIRPCLEALKPDWEALVAGRRGFYLEDKGLTLAIHARYADLQEADVVLAQARRFAKERMDGKHLRLLGGDRFLEMCPVAADKGQTVDYLLEKDPLEGALPVYVGDDDKDESAFSAVRRRGGVAILVAPKPRPSYADCRFTTVGAVRRWLEWLAKRRGSASETQ